MPGRFQQGATIVDKVDAARLERIIRGLSGADSIVLDDGKTEIRTRYALSPHKDLGQRYLIDQVRDAGYEPSIQRFVLNIGVPDLTGTAVSPSGDTVWVADTGGKIYMTTAAGGWPPFAERGEIGNALYDLQCDRLGRLWVSCRLSGSAYGALLISTDAGASWSLRASGTDILTLGSICFQDEQFGMAGGSGGSVIRTADAGGTWYSLDPATFGYEAIDDIAASGPLHFWLVTDNGSLYETRDLGATWLKRSLMLGRLAGIDFHGESTGVIVGSQEAFYTRDGGTTWVAVPVAAELSAVRMADSLRIIASGAGGDIWVSEDGGPTWARFGTECSVAADVWSVASSGDGWFWLTGRDLSRRVGWSASMRSCASYQFADTTWGENISFIHEGVSEPKHRVLLTAHYDATSGSPYDCAPGADDNGTGTVAVIECARALRDERTERSVEFVLFDGEELGLKGSRYFASVLDTGVVFDGDLQLDMIGWEPNAVMSAVICERSGAGPDSIIGNAIGASVDLFGLGLETTVVQAERLSSDQIAFWEVGIPAALLIEGKRSELTPYYHSCSDVADHLNFAFFEVCTKAALGAVARLAGLMPSEIVPKRVALYQNYPNPFNAVTTVSFALPEASNVEVAVYDISGRRVALIERGREEAGVVNRSWNGKDDRGRPLASGVYFLRLRAETSEAVRKIVILR
ncbi:MAG TPA: M20/M25/M40 family metallo-hydrolase [Candidatus Krumholzibacteriaceae bacterium]